jgi:pimeloyl-ACP methyl ester carboxylesterase
MALVGGGGKSSGTGGSDGEQLATSAATLAASNRILTPDTLPSLPPPKETSMPRVDVNGVGVEFRDQGDGPRVLLIHGWPDSGELWRHQIAALVDAGYRVIAPDLRGFGASDRPTDVGSYNLLLLIGDLMAVLEETGSSRVHVVGHDWGAALAWAIAAFDPDRAESLAALSVGHPTAFASAGIEQRRMSWYMLLFQFEDVAERWLSENEFRNLREWSGHPDLDAVTRQLGEPGALTASLAIYRANVPPESLLGSPAAMPSVQCPTLGVWSTDDFALTEEQMTASAQYVEGPWRYERLEGIGHWMQLEAPDEVNRLLLEHLESATG